jgi:hypothetical protein
MASPIQANTITTTEASSHRTGTRPSVVPRCDLWAWSAGTRRSWTSTPPAPASGRGPGARPYAKRWDCPTSPSTPVASTPPRERDGQPPRLRVTRLFSARGAPLDRRSAGRDLAGGSRRGPRPATSSTPGGAAASTSAPAGPARRARARRGAGQHAVQVRSATRRWSSIVQAGRRQPPGPERGPSAPGRHPPGRAGGCPGPWRPEGRPPWPSPPGSVQATAPCRRGPPPAPVRNATASLGLCHAQGPGAGPETGDRRGTPASPRRWQRTPDAHGPLPAAVGHGGSRPSAPGRQHGTPTRARVVLAPARATWEWPRKFTGGESRRSGGLPARHRVLGAVPSSRRALPAQSKREHARAPTTARSPTSRSGGSRRRERRRHTTVAASGSGYWSRPAVTRVCAGRRRPKSASGHHGDHAQAGQSRSRPTLRAGKGRIARASITPARRGRRAADQRLGGPPRPGPPPDRLLRKP